MIKSFLGSVQKYCGRGMGAGQNEGGLKKFQVVQRGGPKRLAHTKRGV